MHPYSARFSDGKLLYEGTMYEHGQHILIETRNSPAVQYAFVLFLLLGRSALLCFLISDILASIFLFSDSVVFSLSCMTQYIIFICSVQC